MVVALDTEGDAVDLIVCGVNVIDDIAILTQDLIGTNGDGDTLAVQKLLLVALESLMSNATEVPLANAIALKDARGVGLAQAVRTVVGDGGVVVNKWLTRLINMTDLDTITANRAREGDIRGSELKLVASIAKVELALGEARSGAQGERGGESGEKDGGLHCVVGDEAEVADSVGWDSATSWVRIESGLDRSSTRCFYTLVRRGGFALTCSYAPASCNVWLGRRACCELGGLHMASAIPGRTRASCEGRDE